MLYTHPQHSSFSSPSSSQSHCTARRMLAQKFSRFVTTPPLSSVDTRMKATSSDWRVRNRRVVARPGSCFHWKRRKSNGMQQTSGRARHDPFDTTDNLDYSPSALLPPLFPPVPATPPPHTPTAHHRRASITLECAVCGSIITPRRQNRQLRTVARIKLHRTYWSWAFPIRTNV